MRGLGARGARLCGFPLAALTQDRAGQQGADGEPHPPGSVAWSSESKPTGFCAASLRPAPLYLPRSGPSTIFDLLCLRSPLAQSPLIPPLSFLAPRRSPHFLSSGTDPWMESSTKLLIGRKLKKKQSLVNVLSLCARSGTAAGRGGGGCGPESLTGPAGPTQVLCAHSTDGRGRRTPHPNPDWNWRTTGRDLPGRGHQRRRKLA